MSLQISMVIFQEEPQLSANELLEALSAHWPDLPAPTDVAERDNTLSLRLGTSDVVIGTMPAPIPWSDLEGPCATSILWRDAAAAIQGHKSHVIITVSGELSPIALSTLLTQVTAGVLASSSQSVGVFWTNAVMVVPKNLFFDFAVKILPLGPPLPIWVDCRVGWTDDSKNASAGFTTGLAALHLMELEAEHASEPPSELRKRFEAVARYLLENGPVIKDGDTLGESENEKIRVVYSSSAFGLKGSVMRLSYEPTKGRSWWKR
jgi:hypothetical protein